MSIQEQAESKYRVSNISTTLFEKIQKGLITKKQDAKAFRLEDMKIDAAKHKKLIGISLFIVEKGMDFQNLFLAKFPSVDDNCKFFIKNDTFTLLGVFYLYSRYLKMNGNDEIGQYIFNNIFESIPQFLKKEYSFSEDQFVEGLMNIVRKAATSELFIYAMMYVSAFCQTIPQTLASDISQPSLMLLANNKLDNNALIELAGDYLQDISAKFMGEVLELE